MASQLQAATHERTRDSRRRRSFYHSSARSGIVGLAEVASAPYPDPTQFDPKSPYFDAKSKPESPRWFHVDVRLLKKTRLLGLPELRTIPELAEMRVLQKGNRLSITPVSAAEWRKITNCWLRMRRPAGPRRARIALRSGDLSRSRAACMTACMAPEAGKGMGTRDELGLACSLHLRARLTYAVMTTRNAPGPKVDERRRCCLVAEALGAMR